MEGLKLSMFTVREFMDVLSGERALLSLKVERTLNPEEQEVAARDLIVEFHELSDPVGTHVELVNHGDAAKCRAQVLMFTLMRSVVELDEESFVDIRAMLADTLSRKKILGMSKDSLLVWIDKERSNAEMRMAKLRDKETVLQSSDDAVRQFEETLAWMMTHNKMSIDVNVISASVYAVMLRNAVDEVKRKRRNR